MLRAYFTEWSQRIRRRANLVTDARRMNPGSRRERKSPRRLARSGGTARHLDVPHGEASGPNLHAALAKVTANAPIPQSALRGRSRPERPRKLLWP